MRALLAEQAHSHLVAITHEDFGKDREAWTGWLERSRADTGEPHRSPAHGAAGDALLTHLGHRENVP